MYTILICFIAIVYHSIPRCQLVFWNFNTINNLIIETSLLSRILIVIFNYYEYSIVILAFNLISNGKMYYRSILIGGDSQMDNNPQETAASKAPAEAQLKLATTAMDSNQKLHTSRNGGDKGSTGIIDVEDAKKIIEEWPPTSKMAAEYTINFYGPPNEATPSRLVWYNNGPCDRFQIKYRIYNPINDIMRAILYLELEGSRSYGTIIKWKSGIYYGCSKRYW